MALENGKRWLMLATGGVALALGGCGGEGGSSMTVSVAAPVPTPTPSAYGTMFDLSVARYLRSEVASLTIERRYNPNVPTLYTVESATARLDASPQALIYAYDNVARALNLQFDGQNIAIPASAMVMQDDDHMRSSRIMLNDDTSAIFQIGRLDSEFRYFAFSQLQLDWNGFPDAGARVSRESYHRFLLGIPTRSPDMPESGVRQYGAGLTSSIVTYDGSGGLLGSGTLSLDFTARTVSAIFPAKQVSSVAGTEPIVATLKFDGGIDLAGNVIQGRVTSPEGFSGSFRGRLFGPAAEVGIIFAIERAGKGVVGTVAGVFKP